MFQSNFLVSLVLLASFYFCDIKCERLEKCEQCVRSEKCTIFGTMSRRDQDLWIEEHSCDGPEEEDLGVLFGFAPAAKGDYICCPNSNIWGVENPTRPRSREDSQKSENLESRQGVNEDDWNSQSHENGQDYLDEKPNPDDGFHYEQSKLPHSRNNHRWQGQGVNRPRANNQMRPTQRNQNIMARPNTPIYNGGNRYNPAYNNPYGGQNQNFNRPPVNQQAFNPNTFVPNTSNQRNNNVGGQCSVTVFPPALPSPCCGLDVAAERMGAGRFVNRQPSNSNRWTRPGSTRRQKREDTPEISLDSRIAGGKETDLYQFPWTVLLKTTFVYGDRESVFNCGGSLISSRYVLTAAHCINDETGRVSRVDVYLAEYDKRTFPRDCVNSPEGRKCIDNVMLQAEDVISHPYYDDVRLQNDVALIRLSENVPYTEYTRPICLPPINIDNPEYSNLRLAAAGWGRNGSVPSQVKQSTVLNLVPQRQCSNFYPQLTNKHLCAMGRSGEDTCKGDSGGPLMMLYEGQYYVSGVVSGKRADAPCGTAIPSLYTNVYHYTNWIMENIRN